ncbi:hypothetical protein, partial [Cetobacterium sp.]|uniref:hypothetical protein n=1 Tax=Cetobacterium sp. TaxID=2071632 RepID=UPI003F2D0532
GFFYIFKSLRPFRETFMYELMYSLFFWQFLFCLGYIFSKYNLFQKIYNWLFKKGINNNFFYLLGLIIIIVLRTLISKLVGEIILFDIFMVDFIFVPAFIVCCIKILRESRLTNIFLILGKHSTNIWLMHSYFTLTYFQNVIYSPKYSVLVLLLTLTLTLTLTVSKVIFILREIKYEI